MHYTYCIVPNKNLPNFILLANGQLENSYGQNTITKLINYKLKPTVNDLSSTNVSPFEYVKTLPYPHISDLP